MNQPGRNRSESAARDRARILCSGAESSALMRAYALLLPVATSLLATTPASAQTGTLLGETVARASEPGGAPSDADGVHFESVFLPASTRPEQPTGFFPELVLDPGRIKPPPATPNRMSFAIHGEYELRFRARTDLPLTPPLRAQDGGGGDLGQNYYVYQWMRYRPVFRYDETLEIRGELDFPRGFIGGPTTQLVDAARDDLAQRKWYGVRPRQLYLQYLTPLGLVRVGHQTSHWGMGLLANDGDHKTLFGDYRRGSVVERMLFATRPGGKDSALLVVLAGDVVFQDPTADLLDGDRALQAIGAVRYEQPHWNIGAYGVLRHQERDGQSSGPFTPYTESLTVGVGDIAGSFNAPIPTTQSYLFGEMEATIIAGDTTYLRTIDQTAGDAKEKVLSFGGAAKLGVVSTATADDGRRFGRLVVAAEYGYASGDADPYDGTTRRFTFDQNHNVGLVLFDQVMAWKTARAATLAQDPNIVNRPNPGLDLLPSEGAIFGASYLNPTAVVRPLHWIDLKGGVVIAQSTADVVSPYRAGALGDYTNYEGGDEHNHDLGVELDAGFDLRVPVTNALVVTGGAEGGVLFPGKAFADAMGNGYPNQYMLNSKFGVQY